MRSIRLTLPIALCLSSTAIAGHVIRAGDGFTTIYLDLPAAIAAANEGDILLVAPGSYSGFTIDGKSVAIFAEPGTLVQIQGDIAIKNLAANQRAILAGLTLDQSANIAPSPASVSAHDCAGCVWLDGCSIASGHGANIYSGQADPGATSFDLVNAKSVVVTSTQLSGGVGGIVYTSTCCSSSGPGGFALHLVSSRASVADSNLIGGDAAGGGFVAIDGTPACEVDNDSTVFLTSSNLVGGDGGSGYNVVGHGASAIDVIGPNGLAFALASTFVGGKAGSNGVSAPPITGIVTKQSGTARHVTYPSFADDGAANSISLQGVAGDALRVGLAKNSSWQLRVPAHGVWDLPYPSPLTKSALGHADANGALTVDLPKIVLGSSEWARVEFVQGFVTATDGSSFFTEPKPLLVLNHDALPDCDSNGRLDILDVLDGAPDINHNFVPDGCDYFGPLYVDSNAAANGNGSPSAPFQNLAQAFNAALDGDTIVLRDGLYTGAENRDLHDADRDLTIESEFGPSNCTIDLMHAGRAFDFDLQDTHHERVFGLTIVDGASDNGGAIQITTTWPNGGLLVADGCVFRNCAATAFFYSGGGALYVGSDAWATIGNCSFDHCTSNAGGAIIAAQGQLVVENCSFTSNTAMPGATANSFGGAIFTSGDLRVSRSTFSGNSGKQGGAIYQLGLHDYYRAFIAHCDFRENNATDTSAGGGAIFIQTGTIRLDDCLLAGNRAPRGGGAWLDCQSNSQGTVFVTNSTFAGNQALNTTGGALAIYGPTLFARNSIFWGNSGAQGGDSVYFSFANFDIDRCAIEPTADPLDAGQLGFLFYGTGNLTVDPKFVDSNGPDNDPLTFQDNVYRLQPTSPCLDAGDNNWLAQDYCDVDGDGDLNEQNPLDLALKPRIKDALSAPDTGVGTAPFIDFGCYERQN